MNVGIYNGAASLAACEKWQEIISRNISAASLPGYKQVKASFDGLTTNSAKATGVGGNATASNMMPRLQSRISLAQGELQHTGSESDFAIQGPGFFRVQMPDGSASYTRNGSFHVNAEKTLVTAQGYQVQGENGPIQFRPGGGNISIASDGTLLQGETVIGKLPIYDFPDATKLHPLNDAMLAPNDANQQPEQLAVAGNVINNHLEGSNVSPLREMVNLIAVSRAYEASQKIITSQDETSAHAIEILGTPQST